MTEISLLQDKLPPGLCLEVQCLFKWFLFFSFFFSCRFLTYKLFIVKIFLRVFFRYFLYSVCLYWSQSFRSKLSTFRKITYIRSDVCHSTAPFLCFNLPFWFPFHYFGDTLLEKCPNYLFWLTVAIALPFAPSLLCSIVAEVTKEFLMTLSVRQIWGLILLDFTDRLILRRPITPLSLHRSGKFPIWKRSLFFK